jgi:predicted ATPase/DNA-binding CsgD family transcriptional regulator
MHLVTLTGPGGVGKTRLALRVAAEVADDFPNGVAFVGLAPIADAGLVLPTIAQVLGVLETGEEPLSERLAAYLRDKRLLLVLDNFEQVLDAAPRIADLLASCHELAALVTSRERLRLSGEREHPVPPLGLPAAGEATPVEVLADSEAMRLFVERAQAIKPDFALTESVAPAVAGICRRLDGLPLAIELAAARVKMLPPSTLLARLERALPLLIGGGRDLPARQQTMRDAIAWSHDLLSPEEQAVFRRLAVFVGGFTLDAAETVAPALGDPGITPFDGVASLLDKNLLRPEPGPGGEPRYEMLETVREYGLERLAASGEEGSVRRHHAAFFLALAERGEDGFFGPEEVAWLDRCEAELGNLRAALDWSVGDGGDSALGLQLDGALWWFWLRRAGLGEGRERLERALAQGLAAPTEVRAKALATAGQLATFQADYGQSLAWLEESLALYRTVADQFGRARAQFFLGDHWQNRGEADPSIAALDDALAEFRALGATAWAGMTLYYLASTASMKQDYERDRALTGEALSLCRQAGFGSGMAMALGHLGTLALGQGDYGEAERYFREALALRLERDDRYGTAVQLRDLAYLAAVRGEVERAVRLDGAAAALREAIGAEIDERDRVNHDRLVARLRDALGHDRFDEAWSAGHGRALEQAVAVAREVVGDAPGVATTSHAAPRATAGLTPRELDVLLLLVEGRSDKEIAAALFVGPRTVQTHVANLFAKLDVHSRAEAAAVAVRQGLV